MRAAILVHADLAGSDFGLMTSQGQTCLDAFLEFGEPVADGRVGGAEEKEGGEAEGRQGRGEPHGANAGGNKRIGEESLMDATPRMNKMLNVARALIYFFLAPLSLNRPALPS